MLELYEQNRGAPPPTSEVVHGSTGGGVTQKGHTRCLPVDEHGLNNSSSMPGTSSRCPPKQSYPDNHSGQQRSSQNRSNDYGNTDMKGDVEVNKSQPHHGPEDGNGSEGRHGDDVKEKCLGGQNLDYKGKSLRDAIKRIDKDKVKPALEKIKKARGGDATRTTDFMDGDDLIERELEDGTELAAESEKSIT